MLTGREQETAFLENHYKRTGSQILVVYGQRGVGKTALLTSFTEKKQTLRYSAGNCSSREQQYLWGRELRSRGKEIAEYPSWRELLECMTIQKGETTADKKVLIIENFQYLLKGDTVPAPPVPFPKYLYTVLLSAEMDRRCTIPQTVRALLSTFESVDRTPENQSAFDATTSNSIEYIGVICPIK